MTMRIRLRLPKHVTAALLALTRFTTPTTMRNINMPIETLGYGYRESVDYAA
jgi:hypothetical protein